MLTLKQKLQRGNKQGAKKQMTARMIKLKNRNRIEKSLKDLQKLKTKLAFQSIKQRDKRALKTEITNIVNNLLKLYNEV